MSFPRPPFSRRTDLAAITADDELLDALGAGLPAALCPTGASGAASDGSAELTLLLAGWVNDVDAVPADGRPMPARSARVGRHSFEYFAAQAIPLPTRSDHDTYPAAKHRAEDVEDPFAVALVDDIEPADPKALRRARRLAAASAVAATVGLFGLIQVEQATPGSAWWPLVEVLDSDRADSVAAQTAVTESLDAAHRLVEEGRLTEAAVALEQAKDKLELVLPEDGYSDLADQVDQVQAQLSGDPGSDPAGAPAVPPSNAGTDVPLSSGEAAGSSGSEEANGQAGTPPSSDSGPASTEAPAPGWPGFDWNLSLSLLLPSEQPADGEGTTPAASDSGTTASESGETGDAASPSEESISPTTESAGTSGPAAESGSGTPTSSGTPSGSSSASTDSGTPAAVGSAGPTSSGTSRSAVAM